MEMKFEEAEKLVDEFIAGRVKHFQKENLNFNKHDIALGSLRAVIELALHDVFRAHMTVEDRLREFIANDNAEE